MDLVDIVHGISGQSGECPWTQWTKSREFGQTGQCLIYCQTSEKAITIRRIYPHILVAISVTQDGKSIDSYYFLLANSFDQSDMFFSNSFSMT